MIISISNILTVCDKNSVPSVSWVEVVVVKCLMAGIKFSPITGGGVEWTVVWTVVDCRQPWAIRSSYSLVCILL